MAALQQARPSPRPLSAVRRLQPSCTPHCPTRRNRQCSLPVPHIRAHAHDEDDVVAAARSFQAERLLRACLTRHLLHRVEHSPPDACLAHLGITLLRCPPTPPALAALAAELGRCGSRVEALAALSRHLSPPQHYTGYETPAGRRCLLAPGEEVQRFCDPGLEAALTRLFVAIERQRAPQVTLGPHCLFHAHLFLHTPRPDSDTSPAPRGSRRRHNGTSTGHTDSSSTGGCGQRTVDAAADAARDICHGYTSSSHDGGGGGSLGVLFHACEYPAWHPQTFPFRLGHCQEGSALVLQPGQLQRRNTLWYQGRLLQLDVSPGLPLCTLLWADTAPLATLYEEDWGQPLADLTLDVVDVMQQRQGHQEQERGGEWEREFGGRGEQRRQGLPVGHGWEEQRGPTQDRMLQGVDLTGQEVGVSTPAGAVGVFAGHVNGRIRLGADSGLQGPELEASPQGAGERVTRVTSTTGAKGKEGHEDSERWGQLPVLYANLRGSGDAEGGWAGADKSDKGWCWEVTD